VFFDQLLRFTIEDVTQEELGRAKSMLQSMLFTQLESRLIVCEDIAKQLMVYGKRTDGRKLAQEIEAVTAQDLRRIAINMFSNKPSISVIGYDVSGIPNYESIVEYTNTFREQVWKQYNVKPLV
jgi:predicted Zn-dependent peptidase